MRNSIKEAFWRKKGYKLSSITIIRLVETITVSIIPSLISVLLILLSQDPNSKAWKVFQFMSFFSFAAFNCYFWVRFAVARRSKREFYMINGVIYIVYAIVSTVAFKYSEDVLLCSMVFATLRGFEGFGSSTMTSIRTTHIIMFCLMILCEIAASIYVHIRSELEAEKAAALKGEREEMGEIPEEYVPPTQKNREVKFLSIEEIGAHMQLDELEGKNAALEISENMPTGIVDEGFRKGNGEKIVFVTPNNIDNDLDENDVLPSNKETNAYEMYSSDSLWNESIYQGRTADNKPILNYDNDDEVVEWHDSTETIEDEPLDNDFEKLITEQPELIEEEFIDSYAAYEPYDNEEIPYTADDLWKKGFYQGRNKNAAVEKKEYLENEEPLFIEDSEDYDEPVELWDNITRQGKSVKVIEDIEEIAEEFAEEIDEIWQEPEMEDPDYDYDSDNLWGDITQGGKSVKNITETELEQQSDFEDYDSDNLWDSVVQGDGILNQDEWIDTVLENDANPYEDYDSDSLWSADIHQGRKKTEE